MKKILLAGYYGFGNLGDEAILEMTLKQILEITDRKNIVVLSGNKEITSKKNASLVETPILLFQAENDTMVLPDGQDKFAEYAQNCELIKVDGARHEIYRENDELLKPYLAKIFNFFEENN